MKPKNQRLILVSAALVAVLVAVLLAMWGLRSQASYFYTPAEIASGKAEPGKASIGNADNGGGTGSSKAVRLGGMVEKGSVQRQPDGVTIHFALTDGRARTPVVYRGITPDLFREGSGAVAEGRLQNGTFVADTILAKLTRLPASSE